MVESRLSGRCLKYSNYIKGYKESGLYPYFRTISKTSGTEVEVDGKKLVMISSNDYLGLTHDPWVIERTTEIIKRYGTGTGGSRFLCGNMDLHHDLEVQLADFVSKKKALVFSTGYSTNLGAITSLLRRNDVILFDKENHASIFDACKMTGARIVPFAHNDAEDAEKRLLRIKERSEDGIILLVTEGVFSMSGTIVDLPAFIKLKEKYPHFYIYLDDAHGLGTMGKQGKGVAKYFDLHDQVDLIMGTFSKSFGSIGGFIAFNDMDLAEYLQHKSRTMIFSAALPAGNVATVLACLEVIKNEPERLEKLWQNLKKVRRGYKEMGIVFGQSDSPIIPIQIGDEHKAVEVSHALVSNNVFALPVVYPAVPRGEAILRTSFMATHTTEQLDYFLDTLGKILKSHDLIP